MALSGSFSGSILNGGYSLRVDWAATQNVANNTSKISCAIYLVQGSGYGLNIASRSDNTITINGVEYTWASPAISNSGGKTVKLATVTSGDIPHNADGSKSVSIAATFNLRATISGTYYGTINASGTAALTTIPRATQPTLSASSADMGTAVTISMPRASSSFTHDLAYRLGSGSWVSIATGRGTSYAWTVPDLTTSLPNATSGQITVRCITKNGSAEIGTKYAYITANVPASVVPTISNVAVAEAVSGLAAQFGAYVQNKSKLSVGITAAGAQGSTIAAYQTTLLGKTYTAATFTSDVLSLSGTLALSVKVKDSRGRWSIAKTVNVTVLAYNPPQITKFQAARVDNNWNPDEQGEYLMMTYNYAVAPVGNKNTARMVMEYKRTSATTWSTVMTKTDLSMSAESKTNNPIVSTDYQYDVRMTLTDWFGASASYQVTLPSGAVLLDFLANGKGLAIGKVADKEGLDFGDDWPIHMPTGKILWQGAKFMNHEQTITLSEPISKQVNGIVLIFSLYRDGAAADASITSHFLPKKQVELFGNGSIGHTFLMAINGGLSVFGAKYLYFTDTTIAGYQNNESAGTAASGITFNNASFVLRYVIGV